MGSDQTSRVVSRQEGFDAGWGMSENDFGPITVIRDEYWQTPVWIGGIVVFEHKPGERCRAWCIPAFDSVDVPDPTDGLFTHTDVPMPEMAYLVGFPLQPRTHRKNRFVHRFAQQLWKTAVLFTKRSRLFRLRNRGEARQVCGAQEEHGPNHEPPRAPRA